MLRYPALDRPSTSTFPTNVFEALEDGAPQDVDIGLTTGSGRSLDQLKRWLGECDASHTECTARTQLSGADYQYPTRLVDTGTEQEPHIRLRIAKDFHLEGPYLTLSHCWGLTPTVKLLTSNVEDMKKAIRYETLSKTFQQAVVVTQSLGFRYIWIDSLCIIQDSVDDWREEGMKMANVYSRSHLNLAAAHSKDGHGGLFQTRDPAKLQPVYIDTDWDDLGKHQLFLRDESLWERGVDRAPLHQRGWVLQERTLALRTAHFGSEQIYWECADRTCTENFPHGPVFGGSFGLLGQINLPRQEGGGHGAQADTQGAWETALEVYSRCAITQPGDKLVAIAGIAQHVQAVSGGCYVAGLWREDMPNNLLWYVVSPKGATRPTTYRAPSWSWAAMDAGIKPRLGIINRPEVSVADCHVSTVLKSPFSQVKDACLRLEWARLFAATLSWDDQGICSTTFHNKVELLVNQDTEIRELAKDLGSERMYPDVLPPPGTVDVFLLPAGQDYFGTFMLSLVLVPVDGKSRGAYRRFGVHEARSATISGLLAYKNDTSRDEWYEDLGKQTIRLV